MDLTEIKKKKASGDFVLAGEKVGITPANASNALNRPGSKYHAEVVSALKEIIEFREALLVK